MVKANTPAPRGRPGRPGRRASARPGPAAATAAVLASLLLATCLVWLGRARHDTAGSQDRVGGPFSLIDDRGAPVTDRSFPGKYLLVYFGYANCPDICPETLNTLTASLDRLGRRADRLQPLFITIDPAHDTPAVLHRYVSQFSPKLVGLTGTGAELDKVAAEYHVVRVQHSGPAGASGIKFDHSAVLYLMAPDGAFIAPIPTDASETVIAEVLKRSLV